MIEFLRIQYRLGRVTNEQLDKLIANKTIVEKDKDYITS